MLPTAATVDADDGWEQFMVSWHTGKINPRSRSRTSMRAARCDRVDGKAWPQHCASNRNAAVL